MKIIAGLLALVRGCDLSSDATFLQFRQNLAQFDTIITEYFHADNMNERNSFRIMN